MCWQDVQIAKANTRASNTWNNSGAVFTTTFPPNLRRSRVIVTITLNTQVGMAAGVRIYAAQDTADPTKIIFSASYLEPLIFDIFNLGADIMNGFTVELDDTGGAGIIEAALVEYELLDPKNLGSPDTTTGGR